MRLSPPAVAGGLPSRRPMAAVPAPAVSATDRAGVEVRLDGVRHRYADAYAVDDVSLRIGAGELVALLGPSGCCNSTLLRVVLPRRCRNMRARSRSCRLTQSTAAAAGRCARSLLPTGADV